MNKSHNLIKIIALALVLSLLGEQALWADIAPRTASVSTSASLAQNPWLLQVPPEHASLEEFHRGTNGKLIVHLQDPHSNFVGQEHMAAALGALSKNHDLPLVLSEGGVGESSLLDLRNALPRKTWQRVAKRWLREAKISGEEYWNLTSDQPLSIIGIENLDSYFESVQAYAGLAKQREKALEYLQSIRRAVKDLKQRTYPADLREYERLASDDVKASERIDRLATWTDSVELLKLNELRSEEKQIDFNAVNLERAVLLEKSESAPGPELSKYNRLLEKYQTIDWDKALEEMDRSEIRMFEDLLTDRPSKILRSIDRYTKLLESAFSIRMTSKEFAEFEANEKNFATFASLAFLNRRLSEEGIFEDLVPYRGILEEGKTDLRKFYASVDARDKVFIENAEKAMADQKQSTAFLIAGGYHTEHLKKLFSAKGYSFAVLRPVVTNETNLKRYEERLLAPVSRLQNTKTSAAIKLDPTRQNVRTALLALVLDQPIFVQEAGMVRAELKAEGARLAERKTASAPAIEPKVSSAAPSPFRPVYLAVLHVWKRLVRSDLEDVTCPLCEQQRTKVIAYNRLNGFSLPIVRCENDGMVFLAKRPRGSWWKQIYTSPQYYANDLGHQFGYGANYRLTETRRREDAARRIKDVEAIRDGKKGVFLDVGSAKGYLVLEARSHGWETIAVDPAAGTDDSLQESGSRVYSALWEEAEIGSAQADVVHFGDVLEHLPNPAKALEKVKRVLKPDGLLVIRVPDLSDLTPKNAPILLSISREHLYYFTRETMTQLLFASGFDLLEVRPSGFVPLQNDEKINATTFFARPHAAARLAETDSGGLKDHFNKTSEHLAWEMSFLESPRTRFLLWSRVSRERGINRGIEQHVVRGPGGFWIHLHLESWFGLSEFFSFLGNGFYLPIHRGLNGSLTVGDDLLIETDSKTDRPEFLVLGNEFIARSVRKWIVGQTTQWLQKPKNHAQALRAMEKFQGLPGRAASLSFAVEDPRLWQSSDVNYWPDAETGGLWIQRRYFAGLPKKFIVFRKAHDLSSVRAAENYRLKSDEMGVKLQLETKRVGDPIVVVGARLAEAEQEGGEGWILQEETIPGKFGGVIYRAIRNEKASDASSWLHDFVSVFPETAMQLGIEVSDSEIRYPDGVELNNRLSDLARRLGLPLRFSFDPVEGKIEPSDFADLWAQHKIAISKKGGKIREHDLTVHAPLDAVLILYAGDLLESSASQLKAFLEPGIWQWLKIRSFKRSAYEISSRVEEIDRRAVIVDTLQALVGVQKAYGDEMVSLTIHLGRLMGGGVWPRDPIGNQKIAAAAQKLVDESKRQRLAMGLVGARLAFAPPLERLQLKARRKKAWVLEDRETSASYFLKVDPDNLLEERLSYEIAKVVGVNAPLVRMVPMDRLLRWKPTFAGVSSEEAAHLQRGWKTFISRARSSYQERVGRKVLAPALLVEDVASIPVERLTPGSGLEELIVYLAMMGGKADFDTRHNFKKVQGRYSVYDAVTKPSAAYFEMPEFFKGRLDNLDWKHLDALIAASSAYSREDFVKMARRAGYSPRDSGPVADRLNDHGKDLANRVYRVLRQENLGDVFKKIEQYTQKIYDQKSKGSIYLYGLTPQEAREWSDRGISYLGQVFAAQVGQREAARFDFNALLKVRPGYGYVLLDYTQMDRNGQKRLIRFGGDDLSLSIHPEATHFHPKFYAALVKNFLRDSSRRRWLSVEAQDVPNSLKITVHPMGARLATGRDEPAAGELKEIHLKNAEEVRIRLKKIFEDKLISIGKFVRLLVTHPETVLPSAGSPGFRETIAETTVIQFMNTPDPSIAPNKLKLILLGMGVVLGKKVILDEFLAVKKADRKTKYPNRESALAELKRRKDNNLLNSPIELMSGKSRDWSLLKAVSKFRIPLPKAAEEYPEHFGALIPSLGKAIENGTQLQWLLNAPAEQIKTVLGAYSYTTEVVLKYRSRPDFSAYLDEASSENLLRHIKNKIGPFQLPKSASTSVPRDETDISLASLLQKVRESRRRDDKVTVYWYLDKNKKTINLQQAEADFNILRENKLLKPVGGREGHRETRYFALTAKAFRILDEKVGARLSEDNRAKQLEARLVAQVKASISAVLENDDAADRLTRQQILKLQRAAKAVWLDFGQREKIQKLLSFYENGPKPVYSARRHDAIVAQAQKALGDAQLKPHFYPEHDKGKFNSLPSEILKTDLPQASGPGWQSYVSEGFPLDSLVLVELALENIRRQVRFEIITEPRSAKNRTFPTAIEGQEADVYVTLEPSSGVFQFNGLTYFYLKHYAGFRMRATFRLEDGHWRPVAGKVVADRDGKPLEGPDSMIEGSATEYDKSGKKAVVWYANLSKTEFDALTAGHTLVVIGRLNASLGGFDYAGRNPWFSLRQYAQETLQVAFRMNGPFSVVIDAHRLKSASGDAVHQGNRQMDGSFHEMDEKGNIVAWHGSLNSEQLSAIPAVHKLVGVKRADTAGRWTLGGKTWGKKKDWANKAVRGTLVYEAGLGRVARDFEILPEASTAAVSAGARLAEKMKAEGRGEMGERSAPDLAYEAEPDQKIAQKGARLSVEDLRIVAESLVENPSVFKNPVPLRLGGGNVAVQIQSVVGARLATGVAPIFIHLSVPDGLIGTDSISPGDLSEARRENSKRRERASATILRTQMEPTDLAKAALERGQALFHRASKAHAGGATVVVNISVDTGSWPSEFMEAVLAEVRGARLALKELQDSNAFVQVVSTAGIPYPEWSDSTASITGSYETVFIAPPSDSILAHAKELNASILSIEDPRPAGVNPSTWNLAPYRALVLIGARLGRTAKRVENPTLDQALGSWIGSGYILDRDAGFTDLKRARMNVKRYVELAVQKIASLTLDQLVLFKKYVETAA